MAQLRARATQIMRCESAETEFLRILFHYVPDCPLRNEDSGMRIVPIQISPESLLFQNGQNGHRLLTFGAIRGGMAGLVLILSILNLLKAVLDTLHQRLPGIGLICVILCVVACGVQLGYSVYREAVRTAVEVGNHQAGRRHLPDRCLSPWRSQEP
jgi:hypothetical protein